MPKKNTRSDKKFGVKVWVKTQDKDIFRSHCFQYHLSMMFVAEKYIQTCLKDFSDKQLEKIIEDRLHNFHKLKNSSQDYEPLGFKIENDYWQKLGFFAVKYKTSIVKIASCLFDYALGSYELRQLEEKHGLTFTYKKKKFFGNPTSIFQERTSDY